MAGKIYVNGVTTDPQDAKISVLDRGFLYGDSVFETMRVHGRQPFAFTEHIARLHASGMRVGFALPWSDAHIREVIDQTITAADLDNGYLRIIATRGGGPLNLDPRVAVAPQLVVMMLELPSLPAEWYTEGRSVWLVSVPRNLKRALDPQAKTGNYMNSVMAVREATAHGADEAIMLDHAGRIAEGSSANVFAWIEDAWCTPPLDVGILGGITRGIVLEMCAAAGIAVHERVLWPADLRGATEIFLSSSVREIIPVTRLDGAPVGDGRVGPRVAQIRALYDARIEAGR